MNGNKKLFSDIFEDSSHPKQRKGRSLEHITRRNDCLIDRYYFFGKFSDKRYNKIIELLSFEFFLSVVTIPEIITDNDTLLHNLKNKRPGASYFKKKWPHLVWPSVSN